VVAAERKEISSHHLDYRRRIYTDFRRVADDGTDFFARRLNERQKAPFDPNYKKMRYQSRWIWDEGEAKNTRRERGDRRCARVTKKSQTFIATFVRDEGE